MNQLINRTVQFLDLGRTDYKECWDFQTRLFDGIVSTKIENRKKPVSEQQTTQNYMLFCEHPHVYTLGKSGEESNLLADASRLEEIGATYYRINRGGDITYHGPGQIVGYPILDLENFFTDIHKYLRFLEEAVMSTLDEYGIQTGRIEGLTGVWVDSESKDPRKICALGVKSSRWVTMHGFAFNVNTDLSYFNNIIPCGIDDKGVTSMQQELGRPVDLKEVSERLKDHLVRIFGMDRRDIEQIETISQ
ncbi:lipoyl(octanoyl) transferase LipB [Fulvivirga sedimenti]|uniref:Octanoyltransferase n=1 Tax=Fulvivirga sedimenti TaxID=2879465 RepID=A0A9X1L1Q4_9BACT|nr:lipoyl(octanoyl) transferase LipB [Fulvivirga sedimenti]